MRRELGNWFVARSRAQIRHSRFGRVRFLRSYGSSSSGLWFLFSDAMVMGLPRVFDTLRARRDWIGKVADLIGSKVTVE